MIFFLRTAAKWLYVISVSLVRTEFSQRLMVRWDKNRVNVTIMHFDQLPLIALEVVCVCVSEACIVRGAGALQSNTSCSFKK